MVAKWNLRRCARIGGTVAQPGRDDHGARIGVGAAAPGRATAPQALQGADPDRAIGFGEECARSAVVPNQAIVAAEVGPGAASVQVDAIVGSNPESSAGIHS